MERLVILQTDNDSKVEEYNEILGKYGVKVIQDVAHTGCVDGYGQEDLDRIRKLLKNSNSDRKILAVMREWSDLFAQNGDVDIVRPLEDLLTVINETRLQVWTLQKDGQSLARHDFQASVPGYIDTSKKSQDPGTFGWDDIFVSAGSQMTYKEMRDQGLKNSARDQVLADWVMRYLYYNKRRDWNISPVNQDETIDFGNSLVDLVRNQPHLNNPEMKRYGLDRLLASALEKGTFIRSPISRREANYWHTAGNGGVPTTPKPTRIQEEKYMVHDLFHFLIGELIFDGATDRLSREVCIMYRMMSEAITMILADMLYIDTLKKSGVDHTYEKESMYPLFAKLKLDFERDPEATRKLLFANVRYVLRGDDSGLKACGAEGLEFEKFKVAASHFSIPDFEWTSKNFDNMAQKSQQIKKWRVSVEQLEKAAGKLMTSQTVRGFVDQMRGKSAVNLEELNHDDLLKLVFDQIYESVIAPAYENKNTIQTVEKETALQKAFLKYISFQLYIFDIYDSVQESAIYRKKIMDYIIQHQGALTLEEINRLRGFYNQFVDILAERKIIDIDDQKLYKQIFPMFPPFYVSYAGDWKEERDIKSISDLVFGKHEKLVGSKPILGRYSVNSMNFQLVSDLHWGLDGQYEMTRNEAIEDLSRRIKDEAREKYLFLLGDIFDGLDGKYNPKDNSDAINELLERISPSFERIIFVPGNHDLRRSPLRDNPWADFKLPANVIMPAGTEPIVTYVGNQQCLIGNLGYDMKLIDPATLGLSKEKILEAYERTPDGRSLLMGKNSIGMFEEMTRNLAVKLTPDIDLVATHVVPHSSMVKFITAENNDELAKIADLNGFKFVKSQPEDEKIAAERKMSLRDYLNFWNLKSFFMGSNILNPALGAQPKQDLTLLYGHNHRGAEKLNLVNGTPIRLITHQKSQSSV